MADGVNEPVNPPLTWADVEHALSACRDALTDLSLSLRDHLFEHDAVRRQESAKIAQELSQRIKG